MPPRGLEDTRVSRKYEAAVQNDRADLYWHSVFIRRPPTLADFATAAIVIALLVICGLGLGQMLAPSASVLARPISLSPLALPNYALRTTLRMLIALGASLLFTLSYATVAAKSRRAEMVLIPLLDVLQSVPVLGYLSFTVTFFVMLFPGSILGPEFAAIFAIFTSQAWNMAFSFYQALRTIPHDIDEAAQAFRFSWWQRFWRLEVPFAMPGLVWNTMMSMSGGWFFVVASEAISVGNISYTLPGVGSYVAKAIETRDLRAIFYAIVAMTITILIYDQLFFRPLVAWSDKFRFEQTAAPSIPKSMVLELFRRSELMQNLGHPIGQAAKSLTRLRLAPLVARTRRALLPRRVGDLLWFATIALALVAVLLLLSRIVAPGLTFADVKQAVFCGFVTLLRVAILVVIATLIWVPIGIYVGLRPKLAEKVQPLAQFLAAFPANLLFPVAVMLIVDFRLDPNIWVSPLMILGTQWYILFNVIAGTTAYPTDFREAAASFRIRGWHWWREVMLPGIFPYYVTGALTASGGAWNASIVSEAMSWGHTKISATGLGAYIAHMTASGDYPRIALGVAVMSTFIVIMNRLLWRPLYAFAEGRTRLD
jgi:NitT/TauT family transport system permease protein